MPRVHLVHWDPEEARARVATLEALGHAVSYLPGADGMSLLRALRAGAPEVCLIDLSRRPSHGREIAMALRTSAATRLVPLVFAGGNAETTARMRQVLPDAVVTTWGRMKTALPRAIRTAPATPFVPPDWLYAGRTVAQKLGLAPGERVAAVGAPPGFSGLLGALPKGASLTADVTGSVQRFIWFVRSRRELEMALVRVTALVTSQVVWLAWPKKASGVTTNVDGNVVRESGLAAGFVDFKVCSIDATWSGLAFKRPRR